MCARFLISIVCECAPLFFIYINETQTCTSFEDNVYLFFWGFACASGASNDNYENGHDRNDDDDDMVVFLLFVAIANWFF